MWGILGGRKCGEYWVVGSVGILGGRKCGKYWMVGRYHFEVAVKLTNPLLSLLSTQKCLCHSLSGPTHKWSPRSSVAL